MPSRDLASVQAIQDKLDELVPRRRAGSGVCRTELEFNNLTFRRGELTAAVEARHFAIASEGEFSDSAELADATAIGTWIDARNERGQIGLLSSVAVVTSIMDNLGFHAADPADITAAVSLRRDRFYEGED